MPLTELQKAEKILLRFLDQLVLPIEDQRILNNLIDDYRKARVQSLKPTKVFLALDREGNVISAGATGSVVVFGIVNDSLVWRIGRDAFAAESDFVEALHDACGVAIQNGITTVEKLN